MSTLFGRALEYMGEAGFGDLPSFTSQYLDLGPNPADDQAQAPEKCLNHGDKEIPQEIHKGRPQYAKARSVKKLSRRLNGFFV